MRKWDERRLAYEIKKQKRGLYILCYFKAPTPTSLTLSATATCRRRSSGP